MYLHFRNEEKPVFTRDTFTNKKEEDSLIIHTKNGRIRGLTLAAATGKLVDTWYGIPYAKKPLGNEQYNIKNKNVF